MWITEKQFGKTVGRTDLKGAKNATFEGALMSLALSRRSLIGSGLSVGLGAGLAGCTYPRPLSVPSLTSPQAYGFGDLKPLDLAIGNLTKITVCTRPFRPAGPRLSAQTKGAKLLVHNYGHGGSGWSLAWGYAEKVRDLIAAKDARSVTVVGAGAMGLTSAIAAAETGARVTIIAREMPMVSPRCIAGPARRVSVQR